MLRWGIVFAAVALTAGGCTADTQQATQTPTDQTALPAATFADDLGALLFNEVPPAYVAVPDETKPLTLEEAVAGADDPEAERKRLSDHGFVRGYSRSWTTQSGPGDVILAFVYEFATLEGAQADAESGLRDARDEGDQFFDVPDVAGAAGITKGGKPGDEQTFQAVFFVRGLRLYLVAIGGPSTHTPSDARALALKMSARAR